MHINVICPEKSLLTLGVKVPPLLQLSVSVTETVPYSVLVIIFKPYSAQKKGTCMVSLQKWKVKYYVLTYLEY